MTDFVLPDAPERTPLWPAIPRHLLPESLNRKVMRDPFGCWTIFGYLDKDGYGVTKAGGSRIPRRAHRVVYELLIGPIPNGMVIDHLCRIKNCVNPDHLEVVTIQENNRRGVQGALKQTCAFGHPWNEENIRQIKTGPRTGKRYCKSCHVERWNRGR